MDVAIIGAGPLDNRIQAARISDAARAADIASAWHRAA